MAFPTRFLRGQWFFFEGWVTLAALFGSRVRQVYLKFVSIIEDVNTEGS